MTKRGNRTKTQFVTINRRETASVYYTDNIYIRDDTILRSSKNFLVVQIVLYGCYVNKQT